VGRKYKICDQSKLHFVTFTAVDWLNIFEDPKHCFIFIDSVKYCQKHKSLEVYSWCIMPNHVHMIIGTSGDTRLQDVIRDLRSFTSRKIRLNLEEIAEFDLNNLYILQHMKRTGERNSRNFDFQLWQQHYHPIELSTNRMMDQRLHYTHNNPVAAGLVEIPEQWKWSSAIDYYGGKGLIDIIFIE